MSQDLNILVAASVDARRTKSQLQKQLNAIGKDLNLTVAVRFRDFDRVSKQVNDLNNKIDAMQKDKSFGINGNSITSETNKVSSGLNKLDADSKKSN